MKAVVTGSAGFIGSHLVDRLVYDGWDVIGIDRKTGPAIEDIEWCGAADAIFHLASPVGPVGVLSEAGHIVDMVVRTTKRVSEWARVYDCPLIDVSTSEVYGSGHADREEDVCTFRPETSARKEYAVAKLAAETMLRNTRDLDVRIVRPFNVAGPRQLSEGGFVLPRFIEQATSNEPLTVYQPGTQVRAFTHVSDIVDGLMAAYTWGRSGEVYNLGNPANATTILNLAAEVDGAVNGVRPSGPNVVIVDPQTIWGPAFREAPDKIPDAAKAHEELHWFPVRSRADVIRDAVGSYLVGSDR